MITEKDNVFSRTTTKYEVKQNNNMQSDINSTLRIENKKRKSNVTCTSINIQAPPNYLSVQPNNLIFKKESSNKTNKVFHSLSITDISNKHNFKQKDLHQNFNIKLGQDICFFEGICFSILRNGNCFKIYCNFEHSTLCVI